MHEVAFGLNSSMSSKKSKFRVIQVVKDSKNGTNNAPSSKTAQHDLTADRS